MMHITLTSRIKAYIGTFLGNREHDPAEIAEVVLNRHFTGDPNAHPALSAVIRSLALDAANQNAKAPGLARRLLTVKQRWPDLID